MGSWPENHDFMSRDRSHLYGLLQEGVARYHHRIHGFCCMTNHLHFAIQVKDKPLSQIMGLLNNSSSEAVEASEKTTHVSEREYSKKFVQQGRSRFDARSVLSVREHGKRATTRLCEPLRQSQGRPLVAFFNIPCCEIPIWEI